MKKPVAAVLAKRRTCTFDPVPTSSAGISKVELREGQTLAKGAKRRVFMTDGTVLDTFELKSPLAYPLAIPIVRLFNGWLQQGLDAIRAELLA